LFWRKSYTERHLNRAKKLLARHKQLTDEARRLLDKATEIRAEAKREIELARGWQEIDDIFGL